MARRKSQPTPSHAPTTPKTAPVGLRIIGGQFRGRKLRYGGDRQVRPMKDRVREALFNLVGPTVADKHALDVFGGTGALGLEAVSRGASGATFVERHYPTAKILRENIASLGIQARCDVVVADTFIWFERRPLLPSTAWVAFVSPPYELFVSRRDDMLRLITGLRDNAPAESIIVVESDERFDFGDLPEPKQWDVRPYPPAVVGIYRKTSLG